MNGIKIEVSIVDDDDRQIRALGGSRHALTDPGDDVQGIHGWRKYLGERIGSAATSIVFAELTREDVLASSEPPIPWEQAVIQKGLGDLDFVATPTIVYDLLLLVADDFPREDFPPLEEIASWDAETLEAVAAWGASIHAFAAGNEDVTVPPIPAVLGGADAGTDDAGGEGAPSAEASAAGDAGPEPEPAAGPAEGGAGDPPATAETPSGADPGSSGAASGEDDAGPARAPKGDRRDGAVPGARKRSRRGQEAQA